jgi:hypothetical protein
MAPVFREDCCILEASTLYRCGFLTPGVRVWEWGVPVRKLTLEITTEDDHIRFENQFVRFAWRPCKPTRGAEPLWICPGCGRLSRKLYNPPPNGLFQCNKCWDISYHVLHQGKWLRQWRYAAAVGVLLAGTPTEGAVPASARDRRKDREKMARRARFREAAAELALAFLEERDHEQRS